MKRTVVILLVVALACDRPARVAGGASLDADTPLSERIANAIALADTTCAFDRRPVHPDPTVLIDEFVRRASEGAFDHTEGWLPTAVDCIGHEPGYDTFVVLDSPRVELEQMSADSARYLLASKELGVLGEGLMTTPRARVDTLAVYRTEFGWRLASPAFWNWMSPKAGPARKWLDSLAGRGP